MVMTSLMSVIAVTLTIALVGSVVYLSEVDDDIKKKFVGKGNLSALIDGCPDGRMRCDPNPHAKCVLPLDNWRDGHCDCNQDCMAGVDCPPAIGPNGEGCNVTTDEECDANQFACTGGKCVRLEKFFDNDVDCEWNCIEPRVQKMCRLFRIDELRKRLLDIKGESRSHVRDFCENLVSRQIPYDCTKDNDKDCKTIAKEKDNCKNKLYEKEKWYKDLPEELPEDQMVQYPIDDM